MNKNIKFLDLKKNYISCKQEIDDSISNVINNTSFINGPIVSTFEKNFAIFSLN